MTLLGIKLKNLREEFQYSQEQLAEMMGTNRTTIALIEAEKRAIKADELQKLATIFDTTTDAILAPMKTPHIRVTKNAINTLEDILLYTLSTCSGLANVGKTVIYKLLYFMEFDYFEKHEKPLTGYPFIRLPLGPAPYKFDEFTDTLQRTGKLTKVVTPYYGKYQSRLIPNIRVEDINLTNDVSQIIHAVLKKYANKSASELSDISHGDAPRQRVKDMQQIQLSDVKYRTHGYSIKAREESKKASNTMIANNKSFAFLLDDDDLYENY